MTRTVQCPSCGSPLELRNRSVKVAKCDACDTVSSIENDSVDPTGKSATLTDFMSAVKVGATGTLKGKMFIAFGRLRYEYDDGYWDEWYLQWEDGTDSWLEEDEGELTLVSLVPPPSNAPDPDSVRPGETIDVGGMSVYVQERGRAVIAGMEGQLPRGIRVGQKIRYIDGSSGGRAVMLEYTENEVEMFVGDEVDFDDIELD